jgi:GTP cyclohydrolase II
MNIDVSNQANLPTTHGDFFIKSFKEGIQEHLAIYSKDFDSIDTPIVRIHSECLTGDTLGSLKCDCGDQLNYALDTIAKEGGMVIYHRQEGRNIGLFNKVNAYALQDEGFNTVEANHQLGFEADMRTYDAIEFILKDFGKTSIKLMTNNPKKIKSLDGIEIVDTIPIKMESNPHNEDYLKIKKEQMGHLL